MDKKTSDLDKESNLIKDKLTSTLMRHIQRYAMYDFPEMDNNNTVSTNQLKGICEGVGAAILKSATTKFKKI